MNVSQLLSKYTNQELERAALAALAADPLRADRLPDLSDDLFPLELDAWRTLRNAIQAGDADAATPEDWTPCADLPEAVRSLEDLHRRRVALQGIAEAGKALERGEDPDRVGSLLSDAGAAVLRAASPAGDRVGRWGNEVAGSLFDRIRRRIEVYKTTGRRVSGLRTGIAPLDDRLNGLRPGLVLVGAGPSVGKTTLVFQIAKNVAKEEAVPVVYVTFENDPEGLVQKALSSASGVKMNELARGMIDDPEMLREHLAAIANDLARVFIVHGGPRFTVDALRIAARDAMRKCGAAQCLIVVDYLQLWAKMSRELQKAGDSRARVEALAGELLGLSKLLQVPVVAICNLSRGNYSQNGASKGGKKGPDEGKAEDMPPGLDALKESGDLEYSADVVIMLHAPKGIISGARAVDLWVKKDRDGEAEYSIPLTFETYQAKFSPVATLTPGRSF
jgi:replicative DNA helicase